MKLFLKITFYGTILCTFITVSLFLRTHTLQANDEILWGVDYSDSQATYLGLDPHKTYSAIIHDLGAKNIKVHIDWNAIEKTKDNFDFTALDNQVKEAENNDVKLILVIGMKTGRWPECHTPDWFAQTPEDEREATILHYISAVVERYKRSDAVQYWQVENEPTVHFGTCPSWYYKEGTTLLQEEVDAVKAQDPSRKIIISDSGELSTWTTVAPIADIVGITMYRSSWNTATKTFGINPYTFLSPEFYATKASIIQKYYNKPVISVELQAEPWASKPLAEASLSEQKKSMNPELFSENVTFAKQAGLHAYYFWGVEWWYWMKVRHADPAIWNKAKQLFTE